MRIFSVLTRGNVSKRVRVVSLVAVIFGAVSTAMLSLFLEDLLPKTDLNARVVLMRVAVLVVALIVVGFAVWLRYGVRQTSGTLFSVQVLDEGMRDRTQEQGGNSRAIAAKRHMSIRVVHRWIDFDTNTVDGVIDLQEQCHEVGAQLQNLVSTTHDDGRHSVAPVMLWPIAMAVGGYLPARTHDFRLVELPTRTGKSAEEFNLEYVAEADIPTLTARTETVEGALGKRIGVHIGLTKTAQLVHHRRFERFRELGVRTLYTISESEDVLTGEDEPHLKGADLERCARLVAGQLAGIKKQHPDTELVVIAQMPKTVAFAVGWQLVQYRCAFYRHTYLMHFDQPTDAFIPMRVRPAQPSTAIRSE
ncbi:hypothetical protein [Saccharopolyspora sp. 5N708]|uniref:hypothetical protein n=1 Tax=Saccharopolyspora sp. 5N708 TaxID=3457424 RepID=UPI003FD0AF0F